MADHSPTHESHQSGEPVLGRLEYAMHFNGGMMGSNSIFFQAARHYAMIEASIVTNMLNYPTPSEVYVVYDSVLAENHCVHPKALASSRTY